MRIVITGGSGLIGRALARELGGAGHDVVVLTRNPEKAGNLPPGVRAARWDGRTSAGWVSLLDADSSTGGTAIIHLAGESISEGRWTAEKKRRIRESRVASGEAVLAAIREAPVKPRVLLQGSAVGYYGDRGNEIVREDASPGNGFLADVCVEWEESTAAVETLGVRRPLLRTGIVLAREGGALPAMSLPFKMMIGGPIGDGRQWFPWIHMEDEIGAIRFLLEREDAQGPFNLSAPTPVTNLELSRALGRVLARPSFLPAPGFALRIALGEMADMLLQGQRAIPSRLMQMGYAFRWPDLEPALRDLLG
jgi:uncharacterized protein (TIGR01777 family)